MSSELERRLDHLLSELPEPDHGMGEVALARALEAVHPVAPTHRRLRTAVLAFAAAGVLLVAAAGSLAAAGALHVSFGKAPKPPSATTRLTLPAGANGIAVVVDGRLSVVTNGGFRLQGLPVSSAALSPHALYVAAGIGRSLVAMRPDGTRAWSQPTGGRVVEIAWEPEGGRIAYVVRTGRRLVLHIIWGNGTNDAVIDRSVRAVRPSWRADSLALAYVGAGGHAVVYDVGHESRSVVPVRAPVTGVAFSTKGDSLAVEEPGGVWLLHQSAAEKVTGTVESFGWKRGQLAVVVPALDNAVVRSFTPVGVSRGSYPVHGIVVAVTPTHIVVQQGRGLVTGHTTLLTVPRGAEVQSLEIR